MKKFLNFFLVLIGLVLIIGCKKKVDPIPEPDPEPGLDLTLNMKAANISTVGASVGDDYLEFDELENNSAQNAHISKISGLGQKTTKKSLNIGSGYGLAGKCNVEEDLETEENQENLYFYFTWDGSFNWMENYTYSVDTSRGVQKKHNFNLNDFNLGLRDYEVYVNYLRFRINTIHGQDIFYEGDAVAENDSGMTFILAEQKIELVHDKYGKGSFNIAVKKTTMIEKLNKYLSEDDTATLDIIGIQLFVAKRDKLAPFWGPNGVEDEETGAHNIEVTRDGVTKKSIYVAYDKEKEEKLISRKTGEEFTELIGTNKGVVWFRSNEGYFSDYTVTEEYLENNGNELPDPTEYLSLIRIFFGINENIENAEEVELSEKKIEYSGGSSKVPKTGVTSDQNPEADPGYFYFMAPIQANSDIYYKESLFDPENEKYKGSTTTREALPLRFDFLLFVTTDEEVYGKEKPFFSVIGKGNEHHDDSFITNQLFPEEERVLLAIYYIRYNEKPVDLLTGEIVSDDIPSMDHSRDWQYQGGIKLPIPEGYTRDDITVTEFSSYIFFNYSFDEFKVTNSEGDNELFKVVGDAIDGEQFYFAREELLNTIAWNFTLVSDKARDESPRRFQMFSAITFKRMSWKSNSAFEKWEWEKVDLTNSEDSKNKEQTLYLYHLLTNFGTNTYYSAEYGEGWKSSSLRDLHDIYLLESRRRDYEIPFDWANRDLYEALTSEDLTLQRRYRLLELLNIRYNNK